MLDLTNPSLQVALIGGGITGLLAIAINLLIAFLQRSWAEAASSINHFRSQYDTALSFFDGGTQRRNVGISLLLSLWDHPEAKANSQVYQKSCALLFCNSCIYILRNGKNRYKGHEQDNLRRMMRKLFEFDEFRKPQGYRNQKGDLVDGIKKYIADARKENEDISDFNPQLTKWVGKLEDVLDDQDELT